MRRLIVAMLLLSTLALAATPTKAQRKHHRPLLQKLRHPRWNPVFPPSRESLIRQNQEIDRLGIRRIQDDAELRTAVADGRLVPIPVSRALKVDPRLPANRRFVRPWTAKFLTDLSEDFYTRFHQPLQVNSAIRPVEVQKKLRRRNRNAAPIEGDTASSHMAGLTVDLQRKHLSKVQVKYLQMRLLYFWSLGLIEVEEEYYQFCFHIMVSGRYGSGDLVPVIQADVPTTLEGQ